MKYAVLCFILFALFLTAGCASPEERSAPPQTQTAAPSVLVEYESPYEQTTVTKTIQGQDAKDLIALLESLSYDPLKVCKCLPPITVLLENGSKYGIDFGSTPHARRYGNPSAQEDLTKEQTALLRRILEPA